MFKKTKIVCTMGPTTDKPGVIEELMKNGMNCARFNFSHGDHAEQLGRIEKVREAARHTDTIIPLLLDTKGPEMRLGSFKDGKVQLVKGNTFRPSVRYAPVEEFEFTLTGNIYTRMMVRKYQNLEGFHASR